MVSTDSKVVCDGIHLIHYMLLELLQLCCLAVVLLSQWFSYKFWWVQRLETVLFATAGVSNQAADKTQIHGAVFRHGLLPRQRQTPLVVRVRGSRAGGERYHACSAIAELRRAVPVAAGVWRAVAAAARGLVSVGVVQLLVSTGDEITVNGGRDHRRATRG